MTDPKGNIIVLLPQMLPGGFRVEYFPEVPEVGGLQVIIWRDGARNDGFCFHAPTPFDAYRTLTKMAEGKRGAAQ